MRLRQVGRKFVQIFLVLWIGGVAPLTYFNIFAISHQVQPYRIALFERMPKSPSLPGLSSLQRQYFTQQLTGHQNLVTNRGFLLSLAQSLVSSLNHLSFFGVIVCLLLALYLGQLTPRSLPAEYSVDLPAPEKPPRLFLPTF